MVAEAFKGKTLHCKSETQLWRFSFGERIFLLLALRRSLGHANYMLHFLGGPSDGMAAGCFSCCTMQCYCVRLLVIKLIIPLMRRVWSWTMILKPFVRLLPLLLLLLYPSPQSPILLL